MLLDSGVAVPVGVAVAVAVGVRVRVAVSVAFGVGVAVGAGVGVSRGKLKSPQLSHKVPQPGLKVDVLSLCPNMRVWPGPPWSRSSSPSAKVKGSS